MDIARTLCAGLLATLSGVAAAASITVTTATDDFGSVASNCSLREAVQSANLNADFGGCTSTGIYHPAVTDVINLPTLGAGAAFLLSRVGTDDSNVAGDLDINGNVRIEGVSAANSIVRGDTGDPDSDRHRLVHVVGGTVTLADLTLRDGLEDNQGAGGGLRTEPGTTTTLRGVVVTANEADGNAGGILNRGTMSINDSAVRGNETREAQSGGGGIFNSSGATLTINDSIVAENFTGNADRAQGGGIFSDAGATLVLDNSVVSENVAEVQGLLTGAGGSGGGIFARGHVTLVQSSISGNTVRSFTPSGGGIQFNDIESALIDRCVIASNRALSSSTTGGSAVGGGIASSSSNSRTEIRDSVIGANLAEGPNSGRGGGLSGRFLVLRSSIVNNQALGRSVTSDVSRGGGFRAMADSAIVNSTVIGNFSEEEGGGIHYEGESGQTLLVRSSTIAGNAAATVGGGLRIDNGIADMSSTVIAGNLAEDSGPDCAGTLGSSGFNLVQDGAGCTIAIQPSDRVGVSAGLAAATNNGGPVAGSSLGVISGLLTRTPLPTSPLLDLADPAGCVDANGATLATDQLGSPRAIDGPDPDATARCDIGAVERVDVLFRDGFDG